METTIWNDEEMKMLDEKTTEYVYELASNYPAGSKIFDGVITCLERHQLNNGKKPVICIQKNKDLRYFVLNQTQRQQIKNLRSKNVSVTTSIIKIGGISKPTFVFSDL
jgi:uncharacterized protein YaiL (DUF2058 family)